MASRPHYGITLAVLALNALAFAASQTLVAPALPAIRQQFAASAGTESFVLTSFLASASVATALLGRLGDTFGKRRMLVLTMSAFGVGSLVAAAAESIEVMVVGRVIQGMAGAVFPLAFGIIRDEFPQRRIATGLGVMSAVFGVGGGIGLMLAGPIVDGLGVRWIFLLSVPATGVAVLATHLLIPESPVRSTSGIDWGGAGLLGLGLTPLLVAIGEANLWGWSSPATVTLTALGLATLLAGTRYERRQAAPLVDMRMMRDPTISATNLAAFMVGFCMFGAYVLTPQFVQLPEAGEAGFGASVTAAGVYLAPLPFVMLGAAPLAGHLAAGIGSRTTLVIGTLTIAAGFALLAIELSHQWAVYASSGILGLGIGFALASLPNLIVGVVEQRVTGIATGINTIMRLAGGALGAQLVVAIAFADTSGGPPGEEGFVVAFALLAGVAVLGAMVALRVPRVGLGAGVPRPSFPYPRVGP